MAGRREKRCEQVHKQQRIDDEEAQAEENGERRPARVLDLRHPSNKALFRVRAMILRIFREALEGQGFIEIHTPKLQPAATESGSELFVVDYFGRTTSLARSPQLAGQMAIAAGFRKVYEIGPVFHANNAKLQQDLTESTSLDIETTLSRPYNDHIQVIDDALKSVFAAAQSMPELQVVRERWPSRDIVWLNETPVISFGEGIQMLRSDGRDIEGDDLSTRDEARLGELVKEKYMTDYYILAKLPADARPFYAYSAEGPQWTNSFVIFLRGQEICHGGQRIQDAQKLRKSMEYWQATGDDKEKYLTGFDSDAPATGGASICLEHLVALLLELRDVRYASLFHLDSKSLPGPP